MDVAKPEASTAIIGVDQFWQGIGQTASTHIVDGQDRIVVAQRPAGVHHFLTAPLEFWIGALHRSEIEFGVTGAGGH